MTGPYELTAMQSAAWHSTDEGEREEMRAAIRRVCRSLLERDPNREAVEILDLGGKLLERVMRERASG